MEVRDLGRGNRNEVIAAIYIWSIKRQDTIAKGVLQHMLLAVTAILLMSILVPIKLEVVLHVIFFGGLTICAFLWAFIERRRSWLLTIRDPFLKASAHQAMVDYLRIKACRPTSLCADPDTDHTPESC